MIRSQQILPIRFYDNLFEQDRFNKFFQISYSSLNYPVSNLPHFQITRNRSLSAPTRFMLRNICSDIDSNFYKVVPEGVFANNQTFIDFFNFLPEAGFTYDDGINPVEGRVRPIGKIDCAKLVSDNPGPFYTPVLGSSAFIEVPIVIGRYDFKINVDKFVKSFGSTFEFNVYLGDNTGLLLDTISSSGIYTYHINNTSETKISIYSDNYITGSDSYEISDVQAIIYASDFAGYLTDIVIDVNSLKTFDSEECGIISYCEPSKNLPIEPGDYYYIIECGQEVYYSEVFCLKTLKEIESFYKITWWNNCDLNNNIIYDSDKLLCNFRNIVYLDAALFKPEYDTTTENTEDGEATLVPTFKRWQKSLNLEIVNASEYLADSLSGIFIHDNAYITPPLNKGQIIQTQEFEIKQITSNIEPVFEDAFQKVTLKFFLSKFYTKAGCCDEFEVFDCDSVYNYKASSNEAVADYYIIENSPPNYSDGLFRHSDDTRVIVKPYEYVYLVDTNKIVRYVFSGGIWSINYYSPIILFVTDFGSYWEVNMNVVPGMFALVKYSKNGGAYITDGSIIAKSDGSADYRFNKYLADGATDFKFKFEMKSPGGCNYGESNIYDQI